MTRVLRATTQFDRDLRKARRRGKELGPLWRVVDALTTGERLAARYGAHKLSGEWVGFWECHVEPDWLLVWRFADDTLILVRTGTHSDIFD